MRLVGRYLCTCFCRLASLANILSHMEHKNVFPLCVCSWFLRVYFLGNDLLHVLEEKILHIIVTPPKVHIAHIYKNNIFDKIANIEVHRRNNFPVTLYIITSQSFCATISCSTRVIQRLYNKIIII